MEIISKTDNSVQPSTNIPLKSNISSFLYNFFTIPKNNLSYYLYIFLAFYFTFFLMFNILFGIRSFKGRKVSKKLRAFLMIFFIIYFILSLSFYCYFHYLILNENTPKATDSILYNLDGIIFRILTLSGLTEAIFLLLGTLVYMCTTFRKNIKNSKFRSYRYLFILIAKLIFLCAQGFLIYYTYKMPFRESIVTITFFVTFISTLFTYLLVDSSNYKLNLENC